MNFNNQTDAAAEIYVGNLSSNTVDSDLKRFFERYGEVKRAKVMIEEKSGMPRGFGFVTFSDAGGIFAAVPRTLDFYPKHKNYFL